MSGAAPASAVPADRRTLAEWLSDPAVDTPTRHALLWALGRYVWDRQEQDPAARLPEPASAWLAQRRPDGFDLAPVGVVRPSRGRIYDWLHHPAPHAALRAVLRALASVPLSASDTLRLVNGYLDAVGLTWQEERRLVPREFEWLNRWLRWVKKRRLAPLPWPADLPRPLGPGEATPRRATFDPDLEWGTFPADDAAGRLDKPGLSRNRVRQRRQVKLRRARDAGAAQGTEIFCKWTLDDPSGLDEYATLVDLLGRGLPVAEPLAGECTSAADGHHVRVVVTRAIPGEALDRWIRAGARPADLPGAAGGPSALAPLDRQHLARHVGLLVGQLHAAGVFHRDCYLCHLFVSRNPDGRLALRFIDLARALRDPWLTRRWAIKDLAALLYSSLDLPTVTRTDRLRVLDAYLLGSDATAVSAAARRRWVRWIAAKAARIARHDTRRFRAAAGA